MWFFVKRLLSLVVVVFLAACASTPEGELTTQRVSNAKLWNASTDRVVTALKDGGTYSNLPSKVNITVDSTRPRVTLKLYLNGNLIKKRYDSSAPYSLYGSDGNNLSGRSMKPGKYKLIVTDRDDQRLRVRFTVKGSSGGTSDEPNSPTSGDASGDSCLKSWSGSLKTISGSYRETYGLRGHSSSNSRIDATKAKFLEPGTGKSVRLMDSDSTCLSGGLVDPSLSASVSWSTFHDTVGVVVGNSKNAVIERMAFMRTGDALVISKGSPNWTLRDSYIAHAGDDVVQNDYMYTGTVDNVLVDQAFTGFSCRLAKYDRGEGYTPGGTMTIKNSLVALRPQKGVYKPGENRSPGHGTFFKWEQKESPGCKLVLKNNIFLATQDSNEVNLYLNPSDSYLVGYKSLIEASGNVIVWLGKGAYPAPVPSGFTVTRDASVWNKARAKWFDQHREFSQYR